MSRFFVDLDDAENHGEGQIFTRSHWHVWCSSFPLIWHWFMIPKNATDYNIIYDLTVIILCHTNYSFENCPLKIKGWFRCIYFVLKKSVPFGGGKSPVVKILGGGVKPSTLPQSSAMVRWWVAIWQDLCGLDLKRLFVWLPKKKLYLHGLGICYHIPFISPSNLRNNT